MRGRAIFRGKNISVDYRIKEDEYIIVTFPVHDVLPTIEQGDAFSLILKNGDDVNLIVTKEPVELENGRLMFKAEMNMSD